MRSENCRHGWAALSRLITLTGGGQGGSGWDIEMTDTANKLTALVRALAQQAARDAYAAAQGMNGKGSHNKAATPAQGDAGGRTDEHHGSAQR